MATVSAHTTKRIYKLKPAPNVPLAATRLADTVVTWTHIPLVPQVALVGQVDGMPVAVIDQIGKAGFRASLCNGKSVGVFRTLDECKQAVASAIQKAPKPATSA